MLLPPVLDRQLVPVDAIEAAGRQLAAVEAAVVVPAGVQGRGGERPREKAGGMAGSVVSSLERTRSSSMDCGALGAALAPLAGLGQSGGVAPRLSET